MKEKGKEFTIFRTQRAGPGHNHNYKIMDNHTTILVDRLLTDILTILPKIENYLLTFSEVVFSPRTLVRQLILCICLHTGAFTMETFLSGLKYVHSFLSKKGRNIKQLKKRMADPDDTQTFDDYVSIAEAIDRINGVDCWRREPRCELYESDRLQARIDECKHLIRRGDIFDTMFTLRGGIARNKFGLLHEGLFSKALGGTKLLVEEYHSWICRGLDFCADGQVLSGEDAIPTDARLAFFNETRHSYGRTALLLSGGAALGFYHAGVVKVLIENGLMPRVIGGASAGSILCGMIGTRTDEECLRDLFQVKGTRAPGHSGYLQLDFFRPQGYANTVMPRVPTHYSCDAAMSSGSPANSVVDFEGQVGSGSGDKRSNLTSRSSPTTEGNSSGLHGGWIRNLKAGFQFVTPRGIQWFTNSIWNVLRGNTKAKDVMMSDTNHFRRCVRATVGNFTFQEAFDRTGRILNITVSPQNRSDPPRLLNYLTSPHVLVWSGAVASSSLPGVFEASKLMVKDADGTERFESTR